MTSAVRYGVSSTNLTQREVGFSASYLAPYWHHHVVLTGLDLDTTYYYKCGDVAAGFSPILSFNTAKVRVELDAAYHDLFFHATCCIV